MDPLEHPDLAFYVTEEPSETSPLPDFFLLLLLFFFLSFDRNTDPCSLSNKSKQWKVKRFTYLLWEHMDDHIQRHTVTSID